MSELRELAGVLGGALLAWSNEGTPAPTPEPLPEPEPVPDSTPDNPDPQPIPEPEPEPVPEPPALDNTYVAETVYSDDPAQGWTYANSWATSVEEVPEGGTDEAIKADLDRWTAFNMYFAEGKKLEDYAGIAFDCKASRQGDSFGVYLTLGNTQTGGMMRIAPTTEYKRYTVLWSDLSVPYFGRFSNIIFDGAGGGEQEPFFFDDIVLLKRTQPPQQQEPLAMPPAPATDGWLTIVGRDFRTESGETWIGRGVNVHDVQQDNACASVSLEQIIPEMKRRLDFAINELKIDFIRFCVYADEGVMNLSEARWNAWKDYVTYAGQKGVRVLFSFWREGTCEGISQAPTAASIPAWRSVVRAFANSGHVMLSLSNEPEGFPSESTKQRWREQYIAVARGIREEEQALGCKPHVIAFQGLGGWSRDINSWRGHIPADLGPICLDVHAYNHAADFQSLFVNMSQAGYPIVCGEMGPAVIQSQTDEVNYNRLDLDPGLYWSTPDDVKALWALLQENKIPSCAWALAIRSYPDMLQDNSGDSCGRGMNLELSDWGKLWKSLP